MTIPNLRKTTAVVLVLALLAGLGIWVRTVQFAHIPAGQRTITDPDSLYHLRLAQFALRDFPRMPAFDPYLNFPLGADVPWPFLQPLLTAGAAKLIALSGALSQDAALETVAFAYPVAMATVALGLLYLLARSFLLPRWASLAAAAFFSLVPAQMAYTTAGRFDHHSGDLVFSLLFLLAGLAVHRSRQGERSRATLLAQGGLALATAAMLLNWVGAVSSLLVLFAAALAVALFDRRDPALPRFLARAGWALAGGGALLALLLGWWAGPARLLTMQLDKPSGFHPAAALMAGFALVLAAALRAGGRSAWRRPLTWAVAAGLAAALALSAGQLWVGTGTFLLKMEPGLDRGIAEFQSAFLATGADPLHPRWSLTQGAGRLSWGVFFFPFFMALAWRRGVGEGRGFPLFLFLSLAGALLALVLVRYRFGAAYAVPAALGSAWLLTLLLPLRSRSRWTRAASALGVAAVAAAFLLPAASFAREKMRNPYHDLANFGSQKTMAWLKANTPPPVVHGGPFDAGVTPAWGVLSFWDLGHNIIGRAQRPAPAAGFFDTLPGHPFRDSMAFFVEEDPARAKALMQKNRLRYLVLSRVPGNVFLAARYLGVEDRRGPPPTPLVLSLWRSRGAATSVAGRLVPGCRYFRLLMEDRFFFPQERSLERYQVYELVEGARLSGAAPPGKLVTATLAVDFSQDKGGVWVEAAVADAAGRFVLTVPYPSDRPSGETRPLGPWQVSVDGQKSVRLVTVSEEQVLGGLTVEVR